MIENRQVRSFTIGQQVLIWDFCQGDKWAHGKIIEQLGPVSFLIQCSDGVRWGKHVDHIQKLNILPKQGNSQVVTLPAGQDETSEVFPSMDSQTDATPEQDVTNSKVTSEPTTAPSSSRHPKQVTKPPDNYEPM